MAIFTTKDSTANTTKGSDCTTEKNPLSTHSAFTCRWCGESYDAKDPVDRTDNGFWCDCCDGFSFFDPKEYDHRRLLLLLETKQNTDVAVNPDNGQHPYLRKHLSPLRYPGGKSKLIDYLYSILRQDQLNTFVEVFAGGASLGLSLLDAGVIDKLILNDLDPAVFAFWHTVLNSPQELIKRLENDVPSHQDLSYAKQILGQSDHSKAELAWSFLLANRLSYSGIIKANPLGGKNGTQEDLLMRWNPKTLAKRIERIHSLREHIELHNEDAFKFIEEYAWWGRKGEGHTLFIDPPYMKAGPALYDCYYRKEDHENLAFLLQSLYREAPQADIILTYDDHPMIRDLYPLADQRILPRNYSITHKRNKRDYNQSVR